MRTQEGQPRVDRGAAVGQSAVVARAFGRIGPTLRLRRPAPDRGAAARRARRPPRSARAPRAPPASRASARRSRHDRFGRRVERTARPAAPRGRRPRPPARTRSPSPAARSPRTSRLHERGAGARDPARLAPAPSGAAPGRDGGSGTTPHWRPAAPGTGWSAPATPESPRAALLEDRVAERPGHPLENGGPRQEAKIVRRQVREQLRLQVVGHEPVAPGERGRAVGLDPARPDRQRGEVETRGPALGVLGELGDSARPAGPLRPRSGAGAPPPRPCAGRPARSPAPGPAPAALPAAAPARRAPRGPAASPPERASRAPRSRRGMPGCRAGAGRPGPRRPRSSIVARAAPRRGTTVPSTETPGDASASNTPGSSGETRSSAAATYVSRTIGSLSFSSTDTHANGRCDREAHCASSVVFPQPGPADRKTTGIAREPSSKPISFSRGTVPPRPCGGSSFDSSSSNADVEDDLELRLPTRFLVEPLVTVPARPAPMILDALTRQPPP